MSTDHADGESQGIITAIPFQLLARCTSVTVGTQALPYHMVELMAWEYPYEYGQAQEDLPGRFVMPACMGRGW